MSATVTQPRLQIAFAGAFAVRLEERVRAHLSMPCIAGAVLDVWYQYPTGPGPTFPARHAFQELPNVLMTPHVSGWAEGMLEARAQLIAENIHRAARGEPPVHLIAASAE